MDEKEVESLIGRYEQELNKKTAETAQLQASSMFSGHQDPNLIEYQLELNDIKEQIEHLLKGHIIKINAEGEPYYDEPDNENSKVFNERGVQFIMNMISPYLNRNTILSNYSEQRIAQIIHSVGDELTSQIFMNYEEFGMDTPFKKKRYPETVKKITHMIESAYNRALGGRELDSLRTARTVMQSERMGMGNYPMGNQIAPVQKKSFLKPWTWFKT